MGSACSCGAMLRSEKRDVSVDEDWSRLNSYEGVAADLCSVRGWNKRRKQVVHVEQKSTSIGVAHDFILRKIRLHSG